MPKLLAAIISAVVAYVPEAILPEDTMSPMTSFMVSTMTGLVTYALILWYLRRLRGD